nr:MAG TPA: hypothetical protein [Caudoviricetes sp.]
MILFDDVYRSIFHISHIRNKTPPILSTPPLQYV